MLTLAGQTLGFTTPWLLLGLMALPILWLLLRAVPPAPVRRLFPGVVLLLGLRDDDNQTDRTPWWLLLLRMAALAALIVGFAGPVLNPRTERPAGAGPLLVLLDGSWADARDWPRRLERVGAALDDAAASGRTVAVATLTDLPAGDLPLQSAESWRPRLAGLAPRPWQADPDTVLAWAATLPAGLDTLWLSDGIAWAGRDRLLRRLATLGQVRVFESPRPVYGLRPGVLRDGKLVLEAQRARPGPAASLSLVARGPDPGGTDRVLLRAPITFAVGETRAGALGFEHQLAGTAGIGPGGIAVAGGARPRSRRHRPGAAARPDHVRGGRNPGGAGPEPALGTAQPGHALRA